MIDGFFDVESRGAFQAFQQLRGDGARLEVIGAHDGAPKGTDGGVGDTQAWFDHYLRGAPLAAQPRVRLWLADGDREDELAGDCVRYDGGDWPVPGTRWRSLALGPGGTLTAARGRKRQRDRVLPAAPVADRPTATRTTRRSPARWAQRTDERIPVLSDMTVAEQLGPLVHDGAAARTTCSAPGRRRSTCACRAPRRRRTSGPSSPTCGRTAPRTRWRPAG